MPTVSLTDFHGHPAKVEAEQVVRLRPALASLGDPAGCTLVDYGSGGVFALGNIQEVAGLFAHLVRLAGLHAPDGTQIFVNADAIAAVAIDTQYAGHSVAIVKPAYQNIRVPERNKIGLLEDVSTAESVLAAAQL